MRLLDPKYRGNRLRYLAQCILATMSVFIVVMIIDAITHAAIIAALGASSFIAFAMPHAHRSRARYLIGGYAVGIFAGVCCHYGHMLSLQEWVPFDEHAWDCFFAAVSVGMTMFLMVVTDTEHPPAAGVALGLAIGECRPVTILVIAVGISTLTLIKHLMRRHLLNLI